MQDVIRLVYPSQCVACGALVASDFGLCPTCWRDTPFIAGLTCQRCGTPLPGDAMEGEEVLCDDCMALNPPWRAGRAAMIYGENARKMILALKHGDRMELARPIAGWMVRAGGDILRPGLLVAPVPLYWLRLFHRRYNQAALVSRQVARLAGLAHCPDLLQRTRQTHSQENRTREGRFDNVAGAFRLHPRRADRALGRDVLLIDDVMTSGATLSAAAMACLDGGAASVSVLVTARVVKDA